MPVLCCYSARQQQKQMSALEKLSNENIRTRPRPRDIPLSNLCNVDGLLVDGFDSENTKLRLGRWASAALSAIITRLTRHTSKENASHHHASITIGNSEEQIARRAELRRLRDKRIQEELHNDYGSDKSSRSVRYISSFTNISGLGRGPRDTIEFAVQQPEKHREEDTSHTTRVDITKLAVQQSETSAEEDPTHRTEDVKRQALPPPTKLQLPTPASQGSFTGQCDGRWVLDVWLSAQEKQSRESSVVRLQHPEMESTAIPEQTSRLSGCLGMASSSEQSTRGRSNDKSDSGDHQNRATHVSRKTPASRSQLKQSYYFRDPEWDKNSSKERNVITESPSEHLIQSYAAAMAFTNSFDNGSLNYVSQTPSFQSSLARSQSPIHELKDQNLQILGLSDFPCEFKRGIFSKALTFP